MPTFVPLKLVLFDCDGTLVDSQHQIGAAMTTAFGECGLDPPTLAAVRQVVGLNLIEAIANLLPNESGERHQAVVANYKLAFAALREQPAHREPLFDGARAALDVLAAQGYSLGIVTGKTRRGLDATLRRNGIADRFATLQTADSAPGKPHPAMVRQAMAELGAVPAATLVVGDTVFDMAMARNAGVAAIGVTWGYHQGTELLRAGAGRLIEDFIDLAPSAATLIGGAQ